MRKVLVALIVGAVSSMSFAGNGYFENLIDPKTGMVDCDKLEPVKRPEGYFSQEENEVESIRFDSDNKVTVTLKDGSKRVFEKDVFHPEKGWRRTY